MHPKLTQSKCLFLLGAALLASSTSWSQTSAGDRPVVKDVDVNFFADGRLRYQILDQDNQDLLGEALTIGVKAGLELDVTNLFSALIEFEGSEQLVDDFNDTTNGLFEAPIIPDVEGFELNRLQIQTEIIPRTRLTLGRQDFALDNWRFLGAWHFRQNQQSYDAIRAESRLGQARINVGYFNKVHRHFGDDSPIGEFRGDSFVLNVSHPAPLGQLSAFHYALDIETGLAASPNNTLSSQTTGLRWHGRRHGSDFGLVWEASIARQSDYADNPIDYAAYYYDLGLELGIGDFKIDIGYEVLGSDDGTALQTPLGSLHEFQGITDRFFRTPNDGLRDIHISGEYNLGDLGPFERIQARLGYHDFDADRNRRDFGQEINIGLSARVNKINLLMEYGDYLSQAGTDEQGLLASDARSLTLSAQYSFD